MNYASSGLGTSSHLSVVMFEQAIGTKMTHVPYKSTGDVVNSMLGGNVDLAIDSMTTVWPHAKQGTVRALGVSTPQRSASAPDVPAIGETIKGFEATAWQGLFAPAGTPKPIVEKIAAEAKRIWNLPEVKVQLSNAGADSVLSESPDAFTAFTRAATREVGRGGQGRRREDRVAVTAHATSNRPIGSPVERLEDLRFLRGRGEFVDDVPSPDALHAVILRSSVAHGRIRSIDASAALKRPGVRAVITAKDIGDDIPVITMRQELLPEFKPYQQPVIAKDKVRYVGEPIAVVVADSAALAEDALEHIALDIEALPAVADRAAAREERKPAVRGRPAAITSSRCRR